MAERLRRIEARIEGSVRSLLESQNVRMMEGIGSLVGGPTG